MYAADVLYVICLQKDCFSSSFQQTPFPISLRPLQVTGNVISLTTELRMSEARGQSKFRQQDGDWTGLEQIFLDRRDYNLRVLKKMKLDESSGGYYGYG